MKGVRIRPESESDIEEIDRVVKGAFGQRDEADLVGAIRDNGNTILGLVAEFPGSGELLGHILFSPMRDPEGNELPAGAGLAPLAVSPDHQRNGIGTRLVEKGIAMLKAETAVGFVVVIGHPDFYSRFGFRPASDFGLEDEYGAGPAFMALEIRGGSLAGTTGLIRYSREFESLGE